MKKLLLLPIVALLFTPFFSQAQTSSNDYVIKSGLGIGPRLGYYKANDADEGNFFGGLQLRGRFSPYFGVEAAVEYRGGQKYEVGGESVKTSFVPVTVSAQLFLPVSEHFAPYGIAGLGAYYTIYDQDGQLLGDDVDNEFNLGYHLGFGVEIPFNQSVALNADYRYLFLNSDTNEQNFNGEYSGNAITVGLMFYL